MLQREQKMTNSAQKHSGPSFAASGTMEDMLPLNGLRGVCAIAILLGHQAEFFLQSPWPDKELLIGWEYFQAVTIFFLLSGIPLARLYSATNKVQTWEGIWEFWRKRWARLAPIYYGTLVLNTIVLFIIYNKVDVLVVMQSFVVCSLFLESWFLSFSYVAGALWQVSVFVLGYLIFPWISNRIRHWSQGGLLWGMLALYVWSTGLWGLAAALYYSVINSGNMSKEEAEQIFFLQLVWHLCCVTRLPQMVIGMLLGEIVEYKRQHATVSSAQTWAKLTDTSSFILLATAIQSPIVQWYYGTEVRSAVSFALEATFVPIHALWLAGTVLACIPTSNQDNESKAIRCWTRTFLSAKPLLRLGEISLSLYCIHLGVLHLYTSAYAYLTLGDRHLTEDMLDPTAGLYVKVPWWHAPIQWLLVLVIADAVSKYFEAPLRKILARPRSTQANSQQCETSPLVANEQSAA